MHGRSPCARGRAGHPVKRLGCERRAEGSARRGERRRLRDGGSNFIAENHPVLRRCARPPGGRRRRRQDGGAAEQLCGQALAAQRRRAQHPPSVRRRSGRLRGVIRMRRTAALVRTAAGTTGLARGRLELATTRTRMDVGAWSRQRGLFGVLPLGVVIRTAGARQNGATPPWTGSVRGEVRRANRPAVLRTREAGRCELPPMPSAPRGSCSSNSASTARRSDSHRGGSCRGTARWHPCGRVRPAEECPG